MSSGKIYTKRGDAGTTSLVNGVKISKADLRLECYGSVDELNSVVGVLTSQIAPLGLEQVKSVLLHIQHQLFNLGSQLACTDQELLKKLPSIETEHITVLEKEMDEMSKNLPALTQFILPGGHMSAAQAHIARTVCRRVERSCCRLAEHEEIPANVIPYLNRLNDYFFVLARHFNHVLGHKEIVWEK